MLRATSALVALLLSVPLTGTFAAAQSVDWWQKDFEAALGAAKDKPAALLLLYCWRDKDDNCAAMFGGTLSDAKVVPMLGDFLCMGVKDDVAGQAVMARYHVVNVPTILFLDPAGAVVDVVPGYVPVASFVDEVKRVRAGTDTIAALRTRAAAAPADLKLQLDLVRKLRAAGDVEGSKATIEAIVAKDPKQASEPAAEAMLLKLTDQIFQPGLAPKDYDLKPLREFLLRQRNKRILFLGWDRTAATEYRRDNLKAATEAVEKAWKNIPADQVLPWGQSVAAKAYANWQELEKLDKGNLRLALEISKKALDEVEKEQKKTPDPAFHANALYLHAAVQLVNNLRKEAFATMDRAIALDPKNENLKKVRAAWLDGSK